MAPANQLPMADVQNFFHDQENSEVSQKLGHMQSVRKMSHVSQGSVVTPAAVGGFLMMTLLLNLMVKEFRKSISI